MPTSDAEVKYEFTPFDGTPGEKYDKWERSLLNAGARADDRGYSVLVNHCIGKSGCNTTSNNQKVHSRGGTTISFFQHDNLWSTLLLSWHLQHGARAYYYFTYLPAKGAQINSPHRKPQLHPRLSGFFCPALGYCSSPSSPC